VPRAAKIKSAQAAPDKNLRAAGQARAPREKIRADYVGFEIPDLFVVGYGLDFAERHRNLPFVGVLRPQIYNPPAAK
jgi:hypoxanthine phosphoribosyltransferase